MVKLGQLSNIMVILFTKNKFLQNNKVDNLTTIPSYNNLNDICRFYVIHSFFE